MTDVQLFMWRWVPIMFKREFEFGESIRLWESIWSDHIPNFADYAAVALVCRHRRYIVILTNCFFECATHWLLGV